MPEVKVEKCKGRVSYDNWGRTRPCSRWAREDGYCNQHHPRNVKLREDAKSAKFERQMNLRMKRHTAMRDLKVAEEKIEELTKERDEARQIGLYWQGVAEHREKRLNQLDELFERWADSNDVVAESYAMQARMVE